MLHALLITALAAAPVKVKEVRLVGRAGPDRPWSDAPTEASRDQQPELAVVLLGSAGERRVVLAPEGVAALSLGGAAVPRAQLRPLAEAGELKVRWLQVEPHAWREKGKVAKNGAGTDFHSNVSMDPKTFGQWLAFDEITYFEHELPESGPVLQAKVEPSEVKGNACPGCAGLGTMRFKAEVALADGRTLATPGAEAVDTFGIKRSVHRLTVRADDSYLGYLTGYLNVPEVFGSAGEGANNQTDRYDGADCADVLVGALRASGHSLGYTSVAALPDLARVVAKPVLWDPDHAPIEPIPGVKVGDIVRIDYAGELQGTTPRSWDHVGAVYEDRSDPNGPFHGGPDGKLDGFDLLIHMGHPNLVVEPLAGQLPAHIDVLRWDPRKLDPPPAKSN